jgi:uncharacterized protein YkwD
MRKIFFSWKIKLKIKLNIIKIRYNLYSSITNLQLILLIMRRTLPILTIILFLLTSEKLFSQNEKYPYSLWGKENLELINKQKENSQLSEEEKTVVVLTNFVRINPKLFAATFLSEYLDSVLDSSKRTNSYVKSLIKDLNSIKKLPPLELNQNLINMALDHATNSGKNGIVGHTNFTKRFKKFNQEKVETYGENCDYGNKRGIDAFMSLLIDENVSSLGHRKNILNPKFLYIGVSFAPHKNYGSNMVMEFCSQYNNIIDPTTKNRPSFFSFLFGN